MSASKNYLSLLLLLCFYVNCIYGAEILIEGKTLFPSVKSPFQGIYWFDSCPTTWSPNQNDAFSISLTNTPTVPPEYASLAYVGQHFNLNAAEGKSFLLSIGGDASSGNPHKLEVTNGTVVLQYYYGVLGGIVFEFYINPTFSSAYNRTVDGDSTAPGSFRFEIDGLSWAIYTTNFSRNIKASGHTFYCSRSKASPSSQWQWNSSNCNPLCNPDCTAVDPAACSTSSVYY